MSTRTAVSRWLVALSEPLVPARTRLATDLDMQACFERDPKWGAAWAGGVVSSLIRSLPQDDPWRRLSAHFPPLEPLIGCAGVSGPFRGAKSTLGDFGSLRDMLDICSPELSDARSDAGLAAVVDPISDEASATIAYAEISWAKAALVLESVDPENLFDVGTEAIRYAAARRRAYCGLGDGFLALVGSTWQWRADRSAEGRYWDTDEVEEEIAESAVDPAAYANICLDPQLHPDFRTTGEPPTF